MITIHNLFDALPILISNDNIFNQLKNDFPETLADLISFKDNPNCSCKNRLIKFFTDKIQQNTNLLNKYIENNIALQNDINNATNLRLSNNYSGRIITIEKTPEAWQQLSLTMVGKMFRSFSLIEKEDKILVYFL